MASKIGRKKINLAVQALNLRKEFPNSDVHIERSNLIWVAQMIPSPLSLKYTVRLTYRLGKDPQINVLKPELDILEGEKLPHTYPGNRLCLYYPGSGEWRGDILLSQVIVPWISEWLLHYEIWLAVSYTHLTLPTN